MDLKTFAVHRKLTNDDPLLTYLTRGAPVPSDVIAASFSDYLEPLSDAISEGLVTDYAKTLAGEVPLVVRPGENGGYEVSGDIPDTLVETVKLLHNVDDETIVSSLVNHNLGTVHGKTCSLYDMEIAQSAEKTRIALAELPSVVPVTAAAAEPITEDVLDDLFNDVPEAEPESAPFSVVEGTLTADTEEPVPEDVNEPEPEEEPDALKSETEPAEDAEARRRQEFSATVRSIYDRFLADLKAYGLDKRLQLNIA